MEQSPKFLIIESSGEVCSVAIAIGNEILAEKSIVESNSHSTYLASFVQDVLSQAEMEISELSAIAISGGPGSYTGLRIGCSVAKGICFGANKPLISTSTLRGLAIAAFEEHPDAAQIVSLIDARRMDAYAQVFDSQLSSLVDEHFLTLDESFINRLRSDTETIAVGSGAHKWIEEFKPKGVLKASKSELYARHLLNEVVLKWGNKDFEDVIYYEPNYIKSVFVTKPKPKF
ncbi:MAG: tRNA (adenosine(37)-N6)-threonylcarbamoyltransferase complex dimerization subunit type 1 TsaB [Bacteroidia bacterium]|nr:tRNA (adenosine(37)-N6)-threonylcarbamoyltransferase complex dimerization subunit type 1 TsaB [Bacteroidia bacterium]NNJ55452.1 tRNA (adenosine(37)-N6)-threonylcarbamoyltransferase complex dimerization subunit type 1 TsaB [Bacteroidia bacterium]